MDIKKQIQALFKEAELYKSHGLFVEAKEKYNNVAKLIQKNDRIANRQSLLDAISKKIAAVENEIKKFDKPAAIPKMSTKAQDLVKNLFSFSENKDEEAASLEGAMALAKFGQFERALIEFNELIKKDALRVSAAKNIIRCHIALSSSDEAVTKYQQWLSEDSFSSGQLEEIRIFFQDILNRKGIDKKLPAVTQAKDAREETRKEEPSEEEFLDISSIAITLDVESKKGAPIELDVNFQRGNTISLIISRDDKDLIENLKVGLKLNNIQCYSPIAVFNGSGIVSEKAPIELGPKKGDYRVDIEIQNT
jgi:tetratricopeptide (TPR) repeat protein